MSFSGRQFTLSGPLFSIPSLRAKGVSIFIQTRRLYSGWTPHPGVSNPSPHLSLSLAWQILSLNVFISLQTSWNGLDSIDHLCFGVQVHLTFSGLCRFLSLPAAGAELLRCCSVLGLNPVTTRSNLNQSQKKIWVRSDCQGLSLVLHAHSSLVLKSQGTSLITGLKKLINKQSTSELCI